jgi:Domain of unknown function (DUF5667)
MKNLKILSIVLALAILFSIPAGVFAAEGTEAETLPDPGTTPDSPFYFMDKWGKQIAMAFTFGAENKAERALAYADERMAEIEAMMARNKFKEASEAGHEYQYCVQTAAQNMEQVKLKGVDAAEKMALMAEKHLEVANRMSENTPEEAQGLLTQAREKAMTCQETALKNMAQGDPEKATQLNLALMERQLNRIRVQAEEADGEAVQQRLEEYNRLGKLGEEISQIARGLGKETTVDQLVGQATAHHLEILAQVQQRVQGQAQEAVGNVLQNCIQNHEQLVIRLQERNQLGPVPEETPLPNMLQNNLEQSTQTMTQTGTQTQAGQGGQGTATAAETQTQTSAQTQTNQGTQGIAEQTATQTQASTQAQIGGQGAQTTSGSGSTTSGQGGSSGGSQQGR